MAGKGLYANIHAKRKRGGKMRKKGAKGAPTAANFRRAAQTARKRYTALDKAEGKVKEGRKMMREGQKERKRMVDTGRAFQFKGGSRHAIEPGEDPKVKYKGLLKENK